MRAASICLLGRSRKAGLPVFPGRVQIGHYSKGCVANRRPGVARRAKSWLAARVVESGGSRASLVHPEVDLLPLPGLGSALSELRTPAAVELDKLASLWVNVGPRSPCVQYRSVTMGGYRFARNPGLESIHLHSKNCLGRRARGPMRTHLMIYCFDTKI